MLTAVPASRTGRWHAAGTRLARHGNKPQLPEPVLASLPAAVRSLLPISLLAAMPSGM